MFITLTMTNNKPILVNVNHITTIYEDLKNAGICIQFVGAEDNYCIVTETPEEIIRIVNNAQVPKILNLHAKGE